ncbi:MAG: hypothetical protein LUE22_09055 [Oscillospiraceae bacterium]|nr:hypothetical protein [Oscillospiraceae bacterium]
MSISTAFPYTKQAFGGGKGAVAEAETSPAAFFAGPSENIRRTVTLVERYHWQAARLSGSEKGYSTAMNVPPGAFMAFRFVRSACGKKSGGPFPVFYL